MMGVTVPRGGRAIRVGLVGLALVLGLGFALARPPAASAFSFTCPFPFPFGPSLSDPPDGLDPCSGSVDDTAPSIPANSSGDIFFDAFMPPQTLPTPTDTFPAPNYGPGVNVGAETHDPFPATPMPGEAIEPGKVIFRMKFHVTNTTGSATGEPAVSYTIDFNLPDRLKITPQTIPGMSSGPGVPASQPLTVTNLSHDTPVTINGVALSGAGAGAFMTGGCLTRTLPPQGSCPLTLNFTPPAAGSFPVTLTVSGNEGSQVQAGGSGTGTTPGGSSGGSSGGSGGAGNAAPPCDCAKVTGFVNDFGVYHASSRLTFKLHTAIACTAGSGAGCSGKASLLAPKGMFFVTPPVKGAKKPVRKTTMSVACSGKCGRTTTASASFALLAINLKNHRLSPKGRGAGPPYKLVLQTNCISPTGVLRPPTRLTLKIAFKKNGNVDYKKSDLDGDGKPDGRQLK